MEPGARAFQYMKMYACRSIVFLLLGMLKHTCTGIIRHKPQECTISFYIFIAFVYCFFYSISIFVVNFDENCWILVELQDFSTNLQDRAPQTQMT